MSAVVLAMPLGLAGCLLPGLKDNPPPAPPPTPVLKPPQWTGGTTLVVSTQQIGNPATGWITTVFAPACTYDGPFAYAAEVTTGSVDNNGSGKFTWTRTVTGSPATASSGVITVNCVGHTGLLAHPTLTATLPALP